MLFLLSETDQNSRVLLYHFMVSNDCAGIASGNNGRCSGRYWPMLPANSHTELWSFSLPRFVVFPISVVN